jgi:hypothetical protein
LITADAVRLFGGARLGAGNMELMKFTTNRVKLDRKKLIGFNQRKPTADKPGVKVLKPMVGTKAVSSAAAA